MFSILPIVSEGQALDDFEDLDVLDATEDIKIAVHDVFTIAREVALSSRALRISAFALETEHEDSHPALVRQVDIPPVLGMDNTRPSFHHEDTVKQIWSDPNSFELIIVHDLKSWGRVSPKLPKRLQLSWECISLLVDISKIKNTSLSQRTRQRAHDSYQTISWFLVAIILHEAQNSILLMVKGNSNIPPQLRSPARKPRQLKWKGQVKDEYAGEIGFWFEIQIFGGVIDILRSPILQPNELKFDYALVVDTQEGWFKVGAREDRGPHQQKSLPFSPQPPHYPIIQDNDTAGSSIRLRFHVRDDEQPHVNHHSSTSDCKDQPSQNSALVRPNWGDSPVSSLSWRTFRTCDYREEELTAGESDIDQSGDCQGK